MSYKTLKLTKPVQVKPNPTEVFILTVKFDEGDDLKLQFDISTNALKYELVYLDYKQKLKDNWNGWCNPTGSDLIPLFADAGLISGPEERRKYFNVGEFWSEDTEYPSEDNDCYARVESTEITYFDGQGLEWHTEKA